MVECESGKDGKRERKKVVLIDTWWNVNDTVKAKTEPEG